MRSSYSKAATNNVCIIAELWLQATTQISDVLFLPQTLGPVTDN